MVERAEQSALFSRGRSPRAVKAGHRRMTTARIGAVPILPLPCSFHLHPWQSVVNGSDGQRRLDSSTKSTACDPALKAGASFSCPASRSSKVIADSLTTDPRENAVGVGATVLASPAADARSPLPAPSDRSAGSTPAPSAPVGGAAPPSVSHGVPDAASRARPASASATAPREDEMHLREPGLVEVDVQLNRVHRVPPSRDDPRGEL